MNYPPNVLHDIASVYSGNGMGQHYTDPQSTIVRRAVTLAQEIKAEHVLDIACGRGVTSLAISAETDAKSITAIDISQEGIEELSQKASTIKAHVYDVAAPEGYGSILNNDCDAVIAKDLFPFLSPAQTDQMLANVEQALQPGGWFLLTAPSTRSQLYRESTPSSESMLYRKIGKAAQEFIQTHLDHFNFTTISNLAGKLDAHNLEMTEAYHQGRASGWILAIAQKIK
jgi:cyclopropane fatty-acyl-phospholipid synthase-like methyltransferase